MSYIEIEYEGKTIAKSIRDNVNVDIISEPVVLIEIDTRQTANQPVSAATFNIRKSSIDTVFDINDYTILMNTSGGNRSVIVVPVDKQVGNIKKLTSDFNSIIISLSSGKIYDEFGDILDTYEISAAGKNMYFHSDGINIYILSGLG